MACIFGSLERFSNSDRLEVAFDQIDIFSGLQTHKLSNGSISIDCPPFYGQPTAPFISNDGRYAAVIFGEVFLNNGAQLNTSNFEEKFLKPFLRNKSEFLRTLEGGFAFALMSDDECTIVNDQHGSFPLHYTINDNTFAFSTKILPLLNVASNSETDQRGLFEYLGLSHSLSGRTLFSSINR